MHNSNKPKMAILDPNTLAVLGLKQLIGGAMPMVEIDSFEDFESFLDEGPENYVHFFVTMNIFLANRQFFNDNRRKTIVLTTSEEQHLPDFNTLCVNQPERQFVHSLLALEHKGHPHHPEAAKGDNKGSLLTPRETEVMVLIVQGFINKEIAAKLNIELSTVITHRKNIMEKLGVKSVSALTMYAVIHGFVDMNKI